MCWLTDLFKSTQEIPSPPDIIMDDTISVADSNLIVDFARLNIPFTKPPRVLRFGMLDTNSMDGLVDIGHNVIYLEPVDKPNHNTMVDWIADQFVSSKGLLAADCVYRIMPGEDDNPKDFTKPHIWYSIHRVCNVGADEDGRFFEFKGVNNPRKDPYRARDKNILWVMSAILY